MHYLSSIYFVNQPLHVSVVFVAHHQEVYCIYTTIDTANSQLKSTTRTNCCVCVYVCMYVCIYIYIHLLMMGYKYARNM